MADLKITIVIPTYNEAENLPGLVSALFSLPLDIYLLVVDDDSPDGTGQAADQLALKFPGRIEVLHRPGKMGLRSAYLGGFQKILDGDADAIVQMDADFSHDPSVLVDMAKLLETHDIVLGSRYVRGGSVDQGLALLEEKPFCIWEFLRAQYPGLAVARCHNRVSHVACGGAEAGPV
jgi:dolichol-phosphate mannosyltransferase